ncbi:SusD/RagB family nutrient-binding outer membrane lipoprotein [Flavobacterium hungaricum]|uniref:SusD/RagB family nutrient-binding outer membrane lipoprotein n=1 Tax=Flavobacterium hungaricum TaxID=2082725 RepID=A0ABR9TS44_9FLAO|nr:SusD/RagB family nutrient-binding outer membrane lipoprotein [Flavobacterium hungaricum]MBE8727842.1 SusD/RagB family nutrient-binding outer membrane lipoprotein [Flavobacterium hungaricum]
MKKYKVILLLVITSILLNSCSEDKMDDINKNVNNPTDVPTRFSITDAMTSTTFGNIGSDLSFYTGIYVELNAGGSGQMYNAETRNGEPISQTTYNNSWNSQYQTMYNLKLIIEKCTTGEEKGNYATLGIAQVLYAYNLALLTDMYGDVPFSEAFQPGVVFQPKLDRQEDLYKIVFATLEDAIVNLGKTSTYASLGTQDLIYQGNKTKWIKAANGLLARYTLRLSFRQPDYTKVLSYVSKSFTSKDEEFKMKNDGIPNPYYQLDNERGYLFASKSLFDKLNARANDPRADGYFEKIQKSTGAPFTYEFFINGVSPQSQNYSYSALINKANPIFMLSYHELLFIKAEAEARNSVAVISTASLTAAVNAAFNKDEVINFSSTNAAGYVAGLGITTNAALLKEIAVQKYLSFYENECVEAYNDYRRLLAMYGSVAAHPIQLENPLNIDKFPLRLTYGNSDVSANKNVKAAFGDGTYVYKENVWWAGGTR